MFSHSHFVEFICEAFHCSAFLASSAEAAAIADGVVTATGNIVLVLAVYWHRNERRRG